MYYCNYCNNGHRYASKTNLDRHQGGCSAAKIAKKRRMDEEINVQSKIKSQKLVQKKRNEWQKETDVELLKNEIKLLHEQLKEKDKTTDKLLKMIANKHDTVIHIDTINNYNLAIMGIVDKCTPFILKALNDIHDRGSIKSITLPEFHDTIRNAYKDASESHGEFGINTDELNEPIRQRVKDIIDESRGNYPGDIEDLDKLSEFLD